MGCDCHFYVEKKTSSYNYEGPRNLSEDRDSKIEEVLDIDSNEKKERWVSADSWVSTEYGWEVENSFYYSRNYYLFSILADVRNYNNITPISEPKGIPKDCSSGYSYIVDRWGSDGHSHSYFTLKELLDVDWNSYEKEYISEFIKTIEKMKSIDNDHEKVRCVFFFDN